MFLNLPNSITKGSESISYIYSASGEKLAKRMKDYSYQYYAGSMVYNYDKSLKYILFEEGLVNKSSGAFTYEYHLKDHLGNTRVAFQPNGGSTTTTQVAEYYPFGSSYLPQSPAGSNKYLYNGKEKQDDVLGGIALDEYDYGARFYDPRIGRWQSIDPAAEKFPEIGTYVYCHNNSVNAIDPDGKTDYKVSKDGTLVKASPFTDALKKFFGFKDKNDRIFAANRDVEPVKLAAGSVGELKNKNYKDEQGKIQNGQYFTIENKTEADKAFNFLAKNTDVEWSQIDSKDKQGGQSTISTSHQNDVEYLGTSLGVEIINSGDEISEMTHSHPYLTSSPGLSGNTVSPDDRRNAKYFKDYNPSKEITFRAFDVKGKKFDYYNEKGVYRYEKVK